MTLLHGLGLAALLFAMGVYGLLTRRNVIGVLMAIEIMLNAAMLNFVIFAHFGSGDAAAGIAFAAFIIAVAACEMAVALAIVVAMYRNKRNLDPATLQDLHG